MKYLNKYNTALDLSKLSEDEYFELYALTNIIYMGGDYFKYNESLREYIITPHNYFNTIVDFQTFKQIHFTR